MIIFYYFPVVFATLVGISIWYGIIRKGLGSDVLLPPEVSRCTIRRVDIEMENLKRNHSLDRHSEILLNRAKKLHIAFWVVIFTAPLGIIWIMAFL